MLRGGVRNGLSRSVGRLYPTGFGGDILAKIERYWVTFGCTVILSVVLGYYGTTCGTMVLVVLVVPWYCPPLSSRV